MKVHPKERTHVRQNISEILFRKYRRGNEFLGVACEAFPAKFYECLLILIKDKGGFRAIDSKLMERRTHLRREGEIGCTAMLFRNDDSELVDDFGFS